MPLETNCNAVVMVTLKSPYRQEKGGGVPALLLHSTTDTLLSYICIKNKKNQHNSFFFFYTGTLDNLVMHTISGCTRLKTKAHNCF